MILRNTKCVMRYQSQDMLNAGYQELDMQMPNAKLLQQETNPSLMIHTDIAYASFLAVRTNPKQTSQNEMQESTLRSPSAHNPQASTSYKKRRKNQVAGSVC